MKPRKPRRSWRARWRSQPPLDCAGPASSYLRRTGAYACEGAATTTAGATDMANSCQQRSSQERPQS